DDLRMWEPCGEPKEMLRRGAGEREDRLVVVADHAEVVTVSDPAVEESRLQSVHILELVDGERVKPLSDLPNGLRILVEEAEGEAEHVLEVEPVHRPLPALVP